MKRLFLAVLAVLLFLPTAYAFPPVDPLWQNKGSGYIEPIGGKAISTYDVATPQQFGCYPDDGFDDTVCIQQAADTGKEVYLSAGTWIKDVRKTLLKTAGQKFRGAGAGIIAKDSTDAEWVTRILVSESMTRAVQTRRQPRVSAEDTGNAEPPINMIFDVENDYVTIQDIFIDNYCDYTNTSPTNLGTDNDVAIFIGTRLGTKIQNVTIRGYLRKAGIYVDVTRSTTTGMVEFSDPVLGQNPVSLGSTGADRTRIIGCQIKGPLKAIFVAGAKNTGGLGYYDESTETVYADEGGRGGVGASDLYIGGNCDLYSRDHHSLQRAADPTMDPDTENIDTMACAIAIDGRRGSSTQPRLRRFHIEDVRITTFEAGRIVLGMAYEGRIDWIHTESGDTSRAILNTSGVEINESDYVNHSYGPIMAKTTNDADITNAGADYIFVNGVGGTAPLSAWFQDRVTNHSLKNVAFDFVEYIKSAVITSLTATSLTAGAFVADYISLNPLSDAPETPVAGRIYQADNEADGWDPLSAFGVSNYFVRYDGTSYQPICYNNGTPVILTAAPPNPLAGQIYWADSENWDPLSLAGNTDYAVIYTGSAYVSLYNKLGVFPSLSVTGVATIKYRSFDDTPDADDTYEGDTITGVAGENLAQWDLLYAKADGTDLKYYKYDANGADKAEAPCAMAVAAVNSGETGTLLVRGIARNGGWGFGTTTDGKAVYAGTDAGAITLTAPATSGDVVAKLGRQLQENRILINLENVTMVEVP